MSLSRTILNIKVTHWLVAGLVALALLALITGPAQAIDLYFQDLNASLSGAYSNMGGQIIADDFTMTDDATITDIVWWGYYDFEPRSFASMFDIDFHTDAGGVPAFGSMYSQSSMVVGGDAGFTAINGNSVYRYQISLTTPFAVSAGETIWLSLIDNDPSTSQWLWSRSEQVGLYAHRNTNPSDITDWSASNGGNFAFRLIGDTTPSIPEPATMTLFGLGLLGLGIIGRNRKRR